MEEESNQETTMNWPKVLTLIYVHGMGLWAFTLIFGHVYFQTVVFTFLLIMLGMLGITTGNHRLWAHSTYQAEKSLKIFLMLCSTLVSQCSIYDWVLDHRIHHKYHGTKDDPYNYKKGFFYAQFISHCVEKPCTKSKEIEMSDIENDEVVMFQKRYYWLIMPLISIVLPWYIPMRFWGEDWFLGFCLVVLMRVSVLLHAAWLMNTATIVWGLDPLDRKSGDTSLVFIVNKTLWPQYHYLLPWDYLSGEFGTYDSGCSTAFIKIYAVLGLAKGLTTISSDGVKEALAKAATENLPVQECLLEYKSVSKIPEILL